ncbi:hypothetical protein Hanom_Chr14g01314321 [Helianthus anomalus]
MTLSVSGDSARISYLRVSEYALSVFLKRLGMLNICSSRSGCGGILVEAPDEALVILFALPLLKPSSARRSSSDIAIYKSLWYEILFE